jgi:two-component system NtrC family sensor kinase
VLALIEGAIKVRVSALGEAVMQLPWLPPSAASLMALVRLAPADAWEEVRYDPGAVLLVARGASLSFGSPSIRCFPEILRDPGILEIALTCLKEASPPIDWTKPRQRKLLAGALRYAHTAQQLAARTGRSDPEIAWLSGLLAPLGWYALAVLDLDSTDTEDVSALARRLLERWPVPPWIAAVAGHLGLSIDTATRLGADPDLFCIVQAAVLLANKNGEAPPLAVGSTLAECLSVLGLDALDPVSLGCLDIAPQMHASTEVGEPVLYDMVRLTAENLRLKNAPRHERLQHENDLLHETLERQRAGEAKKLHVQKLDALAEFAAGAAHEINNPLAVISGQAQYLLGFETEPTRQKALHAIIGQTQRVHQLLSELLQFARPSKPQKQLLDVPGLIRETVLSLTDLALERQVRVNCAEAERGVTIYADPKQILLALECLLRNAIEAAPAGGWASLRMNASALGFTQWIIENNGPGPSTGQVEHLFDPFYSGREAGRGRGMGLPTAWRLARENGGDVTYDANASGPTRFVLTLPCEVLGNGHARLTNGKALLQN